MCDKNNLDMYLKYITMIMSLPSIQIHTLILFVEEPKMLQRLGVHSCCVKCNME